MIKRIQLLSVALMGAAAVACSSPEKMSKMAENVSVKCEPAVLEVIAGNVDAAVSVTYPDGYFHPKAILEVTPVLVFDGGEAAMKPIVYQGEKVKDNYKPVAKAGGTISEKVHFEYEKGMEKAYLELRGVVRYGKKSVNLPSKKVADGCNTTYMLARTDGNATCKADNYQAVITQTAEGQILYNINSSEVRSNELKSQSIKDFQAALDEIQQNGRKTLKSTEVVAYASPDGGEKLNAKLSDQRSKSAEKAFGKVTKGKNVASTDVKSVGQDWEGFQKLVSESKIEDKDLILRVLSMYSDPAVREQEIKNMSEVYTSLKGEVLPELRRARFIANVEFQNYTADELVKMVEQDADVLDEEALLRAATLVKDDAAKIAVYKKAIDKYDSDRARYNLAVTYLHAGNVNKAEQTLNGISTKDADYENLAGVIALRNGDSAAAAKHFAAAGNDAAAANQGVTYILSGDYAKAASALSGSEDNYNKALAYILNNQLFQATDALKDLKGPDAAYLKAIVAARQGKSAEVKSWLKEASKDKALAARAAKDVEFAAYK